MTLFTELLLFKETFYASGGSASWMLSGLFKGKPREESGGLGLHHITEGGSPRPVHSWEGQAPVCSSVSASVSPWLDEAEARPPPSPPLTASDCIISTTGDRLGN